MASLAVLVWLAVILLLIGIVRQEKIMAVLKTFEDLLAAMNETTNTIAANIQILLDKITAGGMTAAEEDQVAAQLQTQVDALKAVAASSTEPAPPVPPVG